MFCDIVKQEMSRDWDSKIFFDNIWQWYNILMLLNVADLLSITFYFEYYGEIDFEACAFLKAISDEKANTETFKP